MAQISVNLSEKLIVTAPVNFSAPVSVKPSSAATEQRFIKRTVFVDIHVPEENELDAVQDRVNEENVKVYRELAKLDEREKAATDQERAEIQIERTATKKKVRLFQEEMLKEFVVGLPEGHGIFLNESTPAEYSPETIEKMCQRRYLRTAMYDAFLKLINGPGDAKKGN